MRITFIVHLSCVLIDFQHVVWRVSPGTQRGIITGLIGYRCFATYTKNYIITGHIDMRTRNVVYTDKNYIITTQIVFRISIMVYTDNYYIITEHICLTI